MNYLKSEIIKCPRCTSTNITIDNYAGEKTGYCDECGYFPIFKSVTMDNKLSPFEKFIIKMTIGLLLLLTSFVITIALKLS